MISETDKNTLVKQVPMFFPLTTLAKENPELTSFVNETFAMVRYLPTLATKDYRRYKKEPVVTDLESEAIAFLLSDYVKLPKWIKADIARVVTIRYMDADLYMNIYNNVHAHRRLRWGMFL